MLFATRIGLVGLLTLAFLLAAERAEAAQVVRFTTSDDIEIVADYYAPREAEHPAPIAILLHMYRSDRSAFEPLAVALNKAGYAVLAIDLRGHGESGGAGAKELAKRAAERDATLFRAMYKDVAAAHAWLNAQDGIDRARVAIVGASVGCSVALDYGFRDRSVDVVVCLTPGDNYLGLDSTRPIHAFKTRAVLLLATEDERSATDKLAALNPKINTEIVGPGQVHGTHMFGKIDGVIERIVRFIDEGIGGRTDGVVVACLGGRAYFASVEQIETAGRCDAASRRWYSSAQEAQTRGLKPAQ